MGRYRSPCRNPLTIFPYCKDQSFTQFHILINDTSEVHFWRNLLKLCYTWSTYVLLLETVIAKEMKNLAKLCQLIKEIVYQISWSQKKKKIKLNIFLVEVIVIESEKKTETTNRWGRQSRWWKNCLKNSRKVITNDSKLMGSSFEGRQNCFQ